MNPAQHRMKELSTLVTAILSCYSHYFTPNPDKLLYVLQRQATLLELGHTKLCIRGTLVCERDVRTCCKFERKDGSWIMGGKDCCGVEPRSPIYMMLEMCPAATPLKIICRHVIGVGPSLPNSL